VRLDRTGNLETVPFQHAGTAERLGIPASRLSESVWWLDSSGAVYGAAEACNAALSAALGTRLPLLIYRVPGISAVQEALVAELLGYSYNTTQRHAQIAAQPWARYATKTAARIELTRNPIQHVLQRLSAIAATQQQTGRRLRTVMTSTPSRAPNQNNRTPTA
jgi:hypothetical protein